MNEKEKIYNLLMSFLTAGLVMKDVDKLLDCFAEDLLGIGLGEQGFVTSLEDVRQVVESGIKAGDTAIYSVEISHMEFKLFCEAFGMICAEVKVNSYQPESGKSGRSQFQQSLVVTKCGEDWKICGLHASTTTITEEEIASYPLKIAEKTLNSLREKIGEEVYLIEEQYRKAVLSDAIAFYIINFTNDVFEKCQLQNDLCIYVEPGDSYSACLKEKTLEYVYLDDQEIFKHCLNLGNIERAFDRGDGEVVSQYRMKCKDGSYIWTKTIIRLITDVINGERKGIMYVKNIDEEKRHAENILQKAERDSMTKLLNKGTFTKMTENLLHSGNGCKTLLMMDVDDFKNINDTYGHPMGDRVLTVIADALTQHFGKDGLVGRVGGDEFAVFLDQMNGSESLNLMVDRFLNQVRSISFPETAAMNISMSAGGASLENGCFEELYQAADKALYKAKAAGKNTFVLYGCGSNHEGETV